MRLQQVCYTKSQLNTSCSCALCTAVIDYAIVVLHSRLPCCNAFVMYAYSLFRTGFILLSFPLIYMAAGVQKCVSHAITTFSVTFYSSVSLSV